MENQDCKTLLIGGSAGSLDVIKQIVGSIPADASLAVIVAIHNRPGGGTLEKILDLHSSFPVSNPGVGDDIQCMNVYVARPYCHVETWAKRFSSEFGTSLEWRLSKIDALFSSAAQTFGPQCIGILLSGRLRDGIKGLGQIAAAGGVIGVQCPEDAMFGDLPASAIECLDKIDCVGGAEALIKFILENLKNNMVKSDAQDAVQQSKNVCS